MPTDGFPRHSGGMNSTPLRLFPSVLAGLCLLTVSACSSTEVDSDGRWVDGEETMTAWIDSTVPATWERVALETTYDDIIDDLGKDTARDRTMLSATYRGVSKNEFADFGADELEISRDLECDPFDAAAAGPKERVSVETCYLDRYQGQSPLPDEFDLFAAWTIFPDGATTTEFFLSNDPD